MNRDKAKEILGGCPPDRSAADDPEWRAAFDELDRDPDLKSWFDAEREFDRAVAANLRQVPVPEALRQQILAVAEPRVVPFPALRFRYAAAAAVLLLGLAWGVFSWMDESREERPLASLASVNFFGELLTFFDREPEFEYSGSDLNDVCDRVKSHGGPESVDVPPSIRNVKEFRCRLFDWEQRKVALFCMQRDERSYHLFVVDDGSRMSAASGGIVPRFTETDGWSFAAWRSRGRTYVLGTEGSREDLEPMF